MGHKRGSIAYEFSEAYKKMACFGTSKHAIKLADNDFTGKIFSFSTMNAYISHGISFGKYCKEIHHCKTVSECRPFVEEYLSVRAGSRSAYTVKLDAASLAKLYRCKTTDFHITTPPRYRANITRSRAKVKMDKHFSEKRNKPLVNFCEGTGLRRCELKRLTGNQLVELNGKYYIWIHGTQAKGGKERFVPIIGEHKDEIIARMKRAGNGLVFQKIHAAADIHSYRAYYAMQVYKEYERHGSALYKAFADPATGKIYQNGIYRCRKEQAGTVFDRYAMLMASRALGHNRISVIAEHYLWQLGEHYSVESAIEQRQAI